MADSTVKKPHSSGEHDAEVVRYRVGEQGYQDVSSYDASRYAGPANEYKQAVMANAYRVLIGPLQGKRILDVGCGTGRGVVDFGREAAIAVGTDASVDMLCYAKSKVNDGRPCCFAVSFAQHLPFADASFDVVTSLNFLHLFSLETQEQMIAEMKRVVKPGGILVLEFDNALNGLLIGPYKRWKGIERGSLPQEIRRVIGHRCRVLRRYGAVFPILWRLFYHFPRFFSSFEKLAYVPPFNFLAHRIYYQLTKYNS